MVEFTSINGNIGESGVGSDSIRKNITKKRIISKVRLVLGSNKVCVVVEGESDQKLFSSLLSKNSGIILLGGWIWVDEIVKHYWKLNNKRVIGIRDKDYSSEPINRQSFFCDYCCAEMMVISVDSCFNQLYRNYYKGNMDSEELRLYCLERLEKLSKFRMLNYRHKWLMSFEGISPSRHYNENIDVMNEAIIDDLNSMNKDNPIDAAKEKMCNKIRKCSTLKDYLDITNGHDFLDLFCKIAIGKHGRHDKEKKNVAKFMIEIFGKNEFMKTNLYEKLLEYQKENKIAIVDE